MIKKYTDQSELFSHWMNATSLIFSELDVLREQGSHWHFREGWVSKTYGSDYIVSATFESFGKSEEDHRQVTITASMKESCEPKVSTKEVLKEHFV